MGESVHSSRFTVHSKMDSCLRRNDRAFYSTSPPSGGKMPPDTGRLGVVGRIFWGRIYPKVLLEFIKNILFYSSTLFCSTKCYDVIHVGDLW